TVPTSAPPSRCRSPMEAAWCSASPAWSAAATGSAPAPPSSGWTACAATCSACRSTNGSTSSGADHWTAPLTRNRHGPQSVEVSDEAQATESGEQPPGLGFLVAVFEVLRPEIAIRGAVLQHVVDGSEDGGGDSDDRLPGSSPRPDAQELGVQVGGLGPGGRPGTLNEQGLEPRI